MGLVVAINLFHQLHTLNVTQAHLSYALLRAGHVVVLKEGLGY